MRSLSNKYPKKTSFLILKRITSWSDHFSFIKKITTYLFSTLLCYFTGKSSEAPTYREILSHFLPNDGRFKSWRKIPAGSGWIVHQGSELFKHWWHKTRWAVRCQEICWLEIQSRSSWYTFHGCCQVILQKIK